jgi:hypothetical protein
MWNRSLVNLLAAGALCSGLGSCVLETANDRPLPTFSIGGRVEGATGTLVLQNSNGTNLIVARDGIFTFEKPMVSSAIYNVTVAVAPDFQRCVVAKGAGTVTQADIRDVAVTCTPNTYTAANTVAAFP